MLKSLTEIKRVSPEALLASLRSESNGSSAEAGVNLVGRARQYGLGLDQYLRLAVDPRQAEKPELYTAADGKLLNGYEASLSFLGLPVRDDFDGGVTLQMASDTFQTFPGARALFPYVVDNMVQWKYRQTTFEKVEPFLSQTRTVAQPEMLTTVVQDSQADYQEPIRAISERGRIPIWTIRASEQTTKFWKFGLGYQTTYEFDRRVSLDILTPYAIRAQKEIERSKVYAATATLINGDGVHTAAPVVTQSSFNSTLVGNATNGLLSFKHLCAWLVSRAQAGVPVDTVAGNWDTYLQWLFMFALPKSNNNLTDAEQLAKTGYQIGGVPILEGRVDFVLSSAAPANQLVGFSKGDTLEQQVEAGSLIAESDRSVRTQEVTYVRSENSGFRCVFGDTRSIFDFGS